jgi:hypothetical protein
MKFFEGRGKAKEKAVQEIQEKKEGKGKKEASDFLQHFADRIPGGRRAMSLALALGIFVFPLGRELAYQTASAESAEVEKVPNPDGPDGEQKELQEFLEELGEHDIETRVTVDGVTVVHVDGAGLQPGEYEVVEFPGGTLQLETDTNYLWGERDYNNVEETPGESELVGDQIRVVMQDFQDQQNLLDLDIDSGVESFSFVIDAYSSPEGNTQDNLELSQQRADDAAETVREIVINEYGVDVNKISVDAIGHGEEGDLSEFVDALEEAGVPIGETQANDNAVAESIIRMMNDGNETRPEVLDAYNETVAPHRHAAGTIVIEKSDVQFMYPSQDNAPVDQEFVASMIVYGKEPDTLRQLIKRIEVEPPIPPPERKKEEEDGEDEPDKDKLRTTSSPPPVPPVAPLPPGDTLERPPQGPGMETPITPPVDADPKPKPKTPEKEPPPWKFVTPTENRPPNGENDETVPPGTREPIGPGADDEPPVPPEGPGVDGPPVPPVGPGTIETPPVPPVGPDDEPPVGPDDEPPPPDTDPPPPPDPPPDPPPPPPPDPRVKSKWLARKMELYMLNLPNRGGQTGIGVGSVAGSGKRPGIGRGAHRSGKTYRKNKGSGHSGKRRR